MNAARDEKIRYIVHFANGSAAMRWYDEPLEEAGTIKDGREEYVVTRVDQPRSPGGLGHAWAELA